MILLGYSWTSILLGTLYASLGLLIVVIAYRRLLKYLDKGRPVSRKYCTLYTLEEHPSAGEVTFYFTSEEPVKYKLMILDEDMNELKIIKSDTSGIGGNIVRFNSIELNNGDYFYCLQTEEQRTMKKMRVIN